MQNHDSKYVYRASIRQACADVSDSDAREALEIEIKDYSKRAYHRALKRLALVNGEYRYDRAHRLLEAALLKRVVRPVSGQWVDLFEQERQLGHMPLGEAYTYLLRLEPGLGRLRESLTSQTSPASEAWRSVRRQLSVSIGPNSDHDAPIVRSQLALSVMAQYFDVLSGRVNGCDLSTSYFGAPVKTVIRTGSF